MSEEQQEQEPAALPALDAPLHSAAGPKTTDREANDRASEKAEDWLELEEEPQ